MYRYENTGSVYRRPKIPRQGSSPDFDHRCFSLPGFPVVSEKQLPYTVTVSLRILTGFSFAHPTGCNLIVITFAHIFFYLVI